MTYITEQDINRLSSEIRAAFSDPEVWAEKVGISIEVLEHLGRCCMAGVTDELLETARRDFGDNPPEEDGEMRMIEVNLNSLLVDACISAFVIGYEAHRQLGDYDGKPE